MILEYAPLCELPSLQNRHPWYCLTVVVEEDQAKLSTPGKDNDSRVEISRY